MLAKTTNSVPTSTKTFIDLVTGAATLTGVDVLDHPPRRPRRPRLPVARPRGPPLARRRPRQQPRPWIHADLRLRHRRERIRRRKPGVVVVIVEDVIDRVPHFRRRLQRALVVALV